MKSSRDAIPHGLTLYEFEYPKGHVSAECWPSPPDGECRHNPSACFIESPMAAWDFAVRFGALKITNAVTGETCFVP